MIYISSSSVKASKISDAVSTLADHGLRNIELSGGTNYYTDLIDDLIRLKEEHNLNYLVHNYFPPPKEPFILNLASLNEKTHQQSVNHAKKAIDLCKAIGANKYGVHAGFFFDPQLRQIGKKMDRVKLADSSMAIDLFCETYSMLKAYAGDIELYIENNVLSAANYKSFSGSNPFMLTNFKDYTDLKERIDFKMILDVAHLFVSCITLQLKFEEELKAFAPVVDYIHISDNDGTADTNNAIGKGTAIDLGLKKLCSREKTITLEIYDGIDRVIESYQQIRKIISND